MTFSSSWTINKNFHKLSLLIIRFFSTHIILISDNLCHFPWLPTGILHSVFIFPAGVSGTKSNHQAIKLITTQLTQLFLLQLLHPLLTSVTIPTLYMIRTNWAIFIRIRARRVRRITSMVTRQMEVAQVRNLLLTIYI